MAALLVHIAVTYNKHSTRPGPAVCWAENGAFPIRVRKVPTCLTCIVLYARDMYAPGAGAGADYCPAEFR